jgi:hypothetical protein
VLIGEEQLKLASPTGFEPVTAVKGPQLAVSYKRRDTDGYQKQFQ